MEAVVQPKRASIPGVQCLSKILWNMLTVMYIATNWDEHRSGDDDNYSRPTHDDNSYNVHPAEPAIRKGLDRKGCDQRRVFGQYDGEG